MLATPGSFLSKKHFPIFLSHTTYNGDEVVQMSKLSRRHHYLPQFYLRSFTPDAERIWVFDREENTFRQQGLEQTAIHKDFYTVTGPDGCKTDAVEKLLAKIEGDTKQIVSRLDDHKPKGEGEDLSTLMMFVALMQTRVPAFDRQQNELTEQSIRWWCKAQHPTPETVADSFRDYQEETGENLENIDPNEFFQMIRDDQFEIENPRQNNVKMMLDLSLKTAPVLDQLHWVVLSAPTGSAFITSDNPFTVVQPPGFDSNGQGYGILTPGATTVMPLSQKTCIMFSGETWPKQYATARKDFVRHINYLIAANSERFVLSGCEPLLKKVVKKTQIDKWRHGQRCQISLPDPYSVSLT